MDKLKVVSIISHSCCFNLDEEKLKCFSRLCKTLLVIQSAVLYIFSGVNLPLSYFEILSSFIRRIFYSCFFSDPYLRPTDTYPDPLNHVLATPVEGYFYGIERRDNRSSRIEHCVCRL